MWFFSDANTIDPRPVPTQEAARNAPSPSTATIMSEEPPPTTPPPTCLVQILHIATETELHSCAASASARLKEESSEYNHDKGETVTFEPWQS